MPALRHCTALEVLRLRFSTFLYTEMNGWELRLRAFRSVQAFEAIIILVRAAPPTVQHIDINAEHYGADLAQFLPSIQKLPWRQLDAALVTLPGLETFSWTVWRHKTPRDMQAFKTMLRRVLPGVSAAGKLRIATY